MSRDYKSSLKRSPQKSGNPMLIGIIIGLFIGLAISLGAALIITSWPSPFVNRSHSAKPTAVKPQSANAARNNSPTPQEPPKPHFDFYTILPGTEAPATDQEVKQAAQQANRRNAQERYFLQVGSFPAETDADNLKAKLALLGVEAVIQSATLPGKGVWHRVRIGPLTGLQELNRIRAILAQNHLPSSLIKIREAGPPQQP